MSNFLLSGRIRADSRRPRSPSMSRTSSSPCALRRRQGPAFLRWALVMSSGQSDGRMAQNGRSACFRSAATSKCSMSARAWSLPKIRRAASTGRSVWRRMAIVVAGPLANLLLAVVVYWGLFLSGTEEPRPILGAPVLSSPAAAAGFENGERVLKVGGEPVQTWQEMRWWCCVARSIRAPSTSK